ncbi:hypothetical protein D3C87_1292920 [compost metagenome]
MGYRDQLFLEFSYFSISEFSNVFLGQYFDYDLSFFHCFIRVVEPKRILPCIKRHDRSTPFFDLKTFYHNLSICCSEFKFMPSRIDLKDIIIMMLALFCISQ